MLRATQYLPDIVQLQKKLFQEFHHRIDHNKAQQQTIGQFIKEKGCSGE